MKKVIDKEVHFCDKCGKEMEYPSNCMGCNKEYCYDCSKTEFVRYSHAIFFQGSGDGKFCIECNATPPDRLVKLMVLYRKIKALTAEYNEWWKDFELRHKAVEKELEEEYENFKESS